MNKYRISKIDVNRQNKYSKIQNINTDKEKNQQNHEQKIVCQGPHSVNLFLCLFYFSGDLANIPGKTKGHIFCDGWQIFSLLHYLPDNTRNLEPPSK